MLRTVANEEGDRGVIDVCSETAARLLMWCGSVPLSHRRHNDFKS